MRWLWRPRRWPPAPLIGLEHGPSRSRSCVRVGQYRSLLSWKFKDRLCFCPRFCNTKNRSEQPACPCRLATSICSRCSGPIVLSRQMVHMPVRVKVQLRASNGCAEDAFSTQGALAHHTLPNRSASFCAGDDPPSQRLVALIWLFGQSVRRH